MTVIPGNDEFDEQPHSIVYLQDEEVFGIIVSYGAFASKVRYIKDGVSFEVWVLNEDILEEE